MREGSRRGSALIPQGAARHSPGWLRQRGKREAGWADGERERGEAGGRLGNSAQLWTIDTTTTGTLRIQRQETQGKCGVGVKRCMEEALRLKAPESKFNKQNDH